MKLNYNFNMKPSYSTSCLVSCSLKESDFYLEKPIDIVSYEVAVLNNSIDNSSTILKIVDYKTKIKVSSNTSEVLVTDINLGGIDYYYELIDIDGKDLPIDLVTLYIDTDAVKISGKIYTNKEVLNQSIKDTYTVFTKHVYEPKEYNFTYYSDRIDITVNKKVKGTKLTCKVKYSSCISVAYINDYKVELNSFVLKTDKTSNAYVKGDIVLINKKEYSTQSDNYMKVKDKINSKKDLDYLLSHNILFTSNSVIGSEEKVIEYIAEKSSHIFAIKDSVYLQLSKGRITVVEDEDKADIRIKRNIDTSGITLYPNDYLDKPSYKLNTNYTLYFDKKINENTQKNLTETFNVDTSINPTGHYYLQVGDKIIKQYFKSDVEIKKVDYSEVEDLFDIEYSYKLPFTYKTKDLKRIEGVCYE